MALDGEDRMVIALTGKDSICFFINRSKIPHDRIFRMYRNKEFGGKLTIISLLIAKKEKQLVYLYTYL